MWGSLIIEDAIGIYLIKEKTRKRIKEKTIFILEGETIYN